MRRHDAHASPLSLCSVQTQAGNCCIPLCEVGIQAVATGQKWDNKNNNNLIWRAKSAVGRA